MTKLEGMSAPALMELLRKPSNGMVAAADKELPSGEENKFLAALEAFLDELEKENG